TGRRIGSPAGYRNPKAPVLGETHCHSPIRLSSVERPFSMDRYCFSRGIHVLLLALAGVVAGSLVRPATAADPPARRTVNRLLNPGFYWDMLGQGAARILRPEIVEMLMAIAQGSDMGPGDGWFHAGQSRFDWDWLRARCDADHNGTITRKEF